MGMEMEAARCWLVIGDCRWKDNGPENMGNPELGVGVRGPWLLIYPGVVWRAGYQEEEDETVFFDVCVIAPWSWNYRPKSIGARR
jgi:hypothetical protein